MRKLIRLETRFGGWARRMRDELAQKANGALRPGTGRGPGTVGAGSEIRLMSEQLDIAEDLGVVLVPVQQERGEVVEVGKPPLQRCERCGEFSWSTIGERRCSCGGR
jgi:hypothetical protein